MFLKTIKIKNKSTAPNLLSSFELLNIKSLLRNHARTSIMTHDNRNTLALYISCYAYRNTQLRALYRNMAQIDIPYEIKVHVQ